MEEYRVDIKVRNNLILRKIESLGFDSIPKFCESIGLSYAGLVPIINMQRSVYTTQGKIRDSVLKLCNKLNCAPEELFSATQMETALETNKRSYEVKEAEMRYMLGQQDVGLLEDHVLDDQKNEAIEDIFNYLTPREGKVIKMRHGLGEYDASTFDEIAKEFGVTRERIRQIEAKAYRKLRHPLQANKLREFLEWV